MEAMAEREALEALEAMEKGIVVLIKKETPTSNASNASNASILPLLPLFLYTSSIMKSLLLQTIQDLIRFQTTKDRPDQLNACADYIADYFKDTPLRVERFESNGIPSVIVTKHTTTPKVFFSGHFDVVPGTPDQFEPRLEGTKLFGRGTMDMKSGDAVMMHVMRDLATTDHDVGLMLTGDEEIGGFDGTAKILDAGYGCEVAIIPDGGEAVHCLVAKEKGVFRVKLVAYGQHAHASKPWLGKNANDLLAEALVALRGTFISLEKHPDDHWVTTCNVGVMKGGMATNQVSGHAEAHCDIRYTEDDSPEQIEKRIRDVLPPGIEILVEPLAPVVNVPLDHPLVSAFRSAVERCGRTCVVGLDHGASDGRFFTERDIPVIISQPDGEHLHAPGEWVDVDAVELYYDVLRSYLDDVARG